MSTSLDAVAADLLRWQAATFPNKTVDTISDHLSDQVGKLWDAYEALDTTSDGHTDIGGSAWVKVDKLRERIADCLMLLLALDAEITGMDGSGVPGDGPIAATADRIASKMATNKRRTWSVKPGDTYASHD